MKDALQSVKDQLEAELLKQQKQRELAEALKKRQAILNGLEAQVRQGRVHQALTDGV